MLNKKSGFTLIEMIVTVAIASILMLMATDVIMKNIIDVNNNNNNSIDIQVGVTNTLDSIKNALKSSTQAHIVGENVFKKNMTKSDLANLDSRYNYIGFYTDDDGNNMIANIMYTGNDTGDRFTVVPVISLGKNDSLSPVKTTYTMEFYKNDKNYNEKLKNKILNLTVKGVSQPIDSNGNVKTNEKPKEFELTSDISLPNANQLMISKYLEGSIKDATAIAYDNFQIGQGKVTSNDMSIVLVVDKSTSMRFVLGEKNEKESSAIFKIQNTNKYIAVSSDITYFYFDDFKSYPLRVIKTFDDEKQLLQSGYGPRKYLAQLALYGFIDDINRLSNKESKLDMYMFYYNTVLQHEDTSDISNGKYIYLKKDMTEYGPYKLDGSSENKQIIKNYMVDKLRLGFEENDYQYIKKTGKNEYTGYKIKQFKQYEENDKEEKGGTNTGKAFLQALELLNQLHEEDKNRKKILVFITDGEPTTMYGKWKYAREYPLEDFDYIVNYEEYKKISDADKTKLKNYNDKDEKGIYFATKYVEEVLNPANGNNLPTTFDKAYIIGFSGTDKDKSRLEEIGAALSKGHNKEDVKILDTSNLDELRGALKEVSNGVAVSMSVFDGPDKLGSK